MNKVETKIVWGVGAKIALLLGILMSLTLLILGIVYIVEYGIEYVGDWQNRTQIIHDVVLASATRWFALSVFLMSVVILAFVKVATKSIDAQKN